jgi:hypothetical protein
MSYQDMSDTYRGPQRGRMEACVREQGGIFVADGRPDIAALGAGVVAGKAQDIDAVIGAACTGPNWDQLDEDAGLLAAVQAAWPTVAAALYPQTA